MFSQQRISRYGHTTGESDCPIQAVATKLYNLGSMKPIDPTFQADYSIAVVQAVSVYYCFFTSIQEVGKEQLEAMDNSEKKIRTILMSQNKNQ